MIDLFDLHQLIYRHTHFPAAPHLTPAEPTLEDRCRVARRRAQDRFDAEGLPRGMVL